jgi:hypothetical protein
VSGPRRYREVADSGAESPWDAPVINATIAARSAADGRPQPA